MNNAIKYFVFILAFVLLAGCTDKADKALDNYETLVNNYAKMNDALAKKDLETFLLIHQKYPNLITDLKNAALECRKLKYSFSRDQLKKFERLNKKFLNAYSQTAVPEDDGSHRV